MSQKNGLKANQLQAVDLLVSGCSVTDAANDIGIARETISRWRSDDAQFIAALWERQEELWHVSGDQLRQNLVKAAKRLEALIDHEDPEIALKAIGCLHKALGSYPHGAHVKARSVDAIEKLHIWETVL